MFGNNNNKFAENAVGDRFDKRVDKSEGEE